MTLPVPCRHLKTASIGALFDTSGSRPPRTEESLPIKGDLPCERCLTNRPNPPRPHPGRPRPDRRRPSRLRPNDVARAGLVPERVRLGTRRARAPGVDVAHRAAAHAPVEPGLPVRLARVRGVPRRLLDRPAVVRARIRRPAQRPRRRPRADRRRGRGQRRRGRRRTSSSVRGRRYRGRDPSHQQPGGQPGAGPATSATRLSACAVSTRTRRCMRSSPTSPCREAITSPPPRDAIYASKSSVVGSIGVLMNGFGFVEAMNSSAWRDAWSPQASTRASSIPSFRPRRRTSRTSGPCSRMSTTNSSRS